MDIFTFLFKYIYIYIYIYIADTSVPKKVFWAPDEPRSGNRKCAVLKSGKDQFSWVASECHQTSNVVCQNCKSKSPRARARARARVCVCVCVCVCVAKFNIIHCKDNAGLFSPYRNAYKYRL